MSRAAGGDFAGRPGRPVVSARLLLYAALALGALASLLPMAWMLSASLMPPGEASSFPPRFIPSRITESQY